MKIFYYILFFIILLLSPFLIMIFINFVYYFIIKKMRPVKLEFKREKPVKLWYKLFVQFPKRYVLDRLTFNPNEFPYMGQWMIVGTQGKGKTATAVYLLHALKRQYPKLKIKTNFCYKYEDEALDHWKQIIKKENGIYGEINVLDEIQNWFNSMESKNFPPEMLGEVSQQRKAHSVIIGTSQLFSRIAKPIREQTHYIFYPVCLFHCFVICRVYEPRFDADANLIEQKFRKMFCFVQTQELRESYDTYKKIQRLAAKGFKDETDQIRVGQSNSNNYYIIEDKKGAKK